MSKKIMYLYLICHSREDIKTHTYIGCVSDYKSRLSQHNGTALGGPRVTRRAAGAWKTVLILELPANRTFEAKKLKKEWKSSSRGLESRIRKGFSLALRYKLKCLVKEEQTNMPVLCILNNLWKNSKIEVANKEALWNKLLRSS